ncbi:TonB-dependent receptor [Oceanisphaera profunda]|uniref:TonB-dependent receptor n=1 Tax=Oceanisphaera profunda TaxID=1416627 RepID=UPI0013748254|nr:TonB-dependent receptor [Oceanisphaera profunda]
MPKLPFLPSILSSAVALGLITALPTAVANEVYTFDTTTVAASSEADSLQDTAPASVSVIDETELNKPGNTHLADVLAQTPNVNLSAGASRGKYYQIRGIGERSQFTDTVNPSVAVVVDGIDMSAMTMGATLLDAKQVQVLRGPQGSQQGANAIGGLINIIANEPSDTLTGDVELTLAEYNTQNLSAAVGGPISDKVAYRIAAQRNTSDGFINNDYLNRDDTNNIDETLLRTKFRIAATEDLDLDLTAFYANIDNGYDAFALDNTRHTLSDQPGHDRQETLALSGKSSWYGNANFIQETAISISKSNLEYGYDVDWTNPVFQPAANNHTDNYSRDERGATLDVRFISTEESRLFKDSTGWSGGLYYFYRSSDLTRDYTKNLTAFTSEYETNRYAGYGELSTNLTDKLTWINGLRLEQDSTLYSDNTGERSKPTEHLWGGRTALEYQTSERQMLYGLIARGYKVGGYNANSSLPNELRKYESETLWNFELGAKHNLLDDTLHTQVAVFFQQRDDAQVNATRTELGAAFDYTDNAKKAYSYGLEAQAQWQASDAVRLHGSLGLLQTELTEPGASFDGRGAAHSPEYQFALGVSFDHGSGWFSGLDVEGKDEFYFSDSYNSTTDAYALLNARFGYQQDNWSVTLWGKNLTDEDYIVRGFNFPNNPYKAGVAEDYVQLGAPRMFGVTTKYAF